MDCLGTYLTHARTLKAFVFKVLAVLRNGLPRYILATCSLLHTRCLRLHCGGGFFWGAGMLIFIHSMVVFMHAIHVDSNVLGAHVYI